MLDASSFAVNPALFPRLPYDGDKAFRPVGVIALFPNVLLVNPSVPAASVKELVALGQGKEERCLTPRLATARRSIWLVRCSRARPVSTCCTCPTKAVHRRSTM